MNTQPEATEDTLGVRLLQMIQTVQQDQLKVLQILGTLIAGMEALEKRVQKLERVHARGNGGEGMPEE